MRKLRRLLIRQKRLTRLGRRVVGISAVMLAICVCFFIIGTGTSSKKSNEVEAMNRFLEEEEETEERPCVCIDAGHGGSDCGAEYAGNYEKDQVLEIAKLVQRHLESAGIKVIMTRSADEYIGLDERVEICNNASCDALISIHRNFYEGDTSVRGVETWIQSSKPQDSYLLADYIMEELSDVSGVKNRGIKTGSMTDAEEDYRLNGNSNCASCLLELGFMTNSIDTELVTVNREESAKAIADGIVKYLRSQENSGK